MWRMLAALALIGAGWVAPLRAAEFPQSVIDAQLRQARTPVVVDLSGIAPGPAKELHYLGRTVLVYRRTPADLAYLRAGRTEVLANPSGAGFRAVIEDQYLSSVDIARVRLLLVTQPTVEKRRFRSLDDRFLVVSGFSPAGCALRLMPESARPFPAAPFMGLCSGMWFDVAGRVLKNHWRVPPMRSKALSGGGLLIPPHHYKGRNELVIGVPPQATIPRVDTAALQAAVYARASPVRRLASAAAYNDFRTVAQLINSGVSVKNTHPRPYPLDAAVVGGSKELVTFLLVNAARPTRNTMQLARMLNRRDVETMLNAFAQIPVK